MSVHNCLMADIKFNDGHPFPKSYPRVRISNDMEVTSPVGIRLRGRPDSVELPFDLTAVVEVVEGRFSITELTLKRADGGPAIGAGHLAKLRLGRFIHETVFVSNSLVFISREFVAADGHASVVWEASGEESWQRELDAIRELASPRSDLALLARFYRLSRLGFYDATGTLASTFQVNGSTVRRWLAEAVAAGELRPEERGK